MDAELSRRRGGGRLHGEEEELLPFGAIELLWIQQPHNFIKFINIECCKSSDVAME